MTPPARPPSTALSPPPSTDRRGLARCEGRAGSGRGKDALLLVGRSRDALAGASCPLGLRFFLRSSIPEPRGKHLSRTGWTQSSRQRFPTRGLLVLMAAGKPRTELSPHTGVSSQAQAASSRSAVGHHGTEQSLGSEKHPGNSQPGITPQRFLPELQKRGFQPPWSREGLPIPGARAETAGGTRHP